MKVREEIIVLTKPFRRLLGKEDSEDANTYSNVGAQIETFTIGSIYYTLTRGHKLYKTKY